MQITVNINTEISLFQLFVDLTYHLSFKVHELHSCAKSDLLFRYYLSMQRSIKSLQDALNDIQLFFL